MYSYDDRLRAVQLYIKLGNRAGLTIRQLGYPTKNALKAWHRAYEQRHGLPKAYMREPKYTLAQRKLAVDHYVDNGRCLAVTIKALGYPSRSLLAGWIQEALPELRPHVGQVQEALSSQAKQSAVMALCLRRGSAQAVAQELGVSRPSLYNWRNQLLSNEALASMKPQQDPSLGSERDELERELERLQRDVKRLKLEQDILKKANELLKKELGIDQQLLTNREKTQLVDALRSTHALADLLAEVELPRSSFFYHRARLELGDKLGVPLVLRQKQVVPARQLLGERALAPIFGMRGDAGEQAFDSRLPRKGEYLGGARNDLPMHPVVKRRPQIIAALFVFAQALPVRPLQISVLHIDHEQGRLFRIEPRIGRFRRTIIIERTEISLPVHQNLFTKRPRSS